MTVPVGERISSMHDDLLVYVRRHAGRLLARDDTEDLVQAIQARALEHAEDCVFADREAFLAWLYKVAASHLADRHSYWAALRRTPDRLLRLTRPGSGAADARSVPEPAAAITGPGTRAGRNEEARLAERALGLLLPRDRAFVEWSVADVPLEEQARRLAISYTAAKQGRNRALVRLRTAYAALTRRRT